jgi:hypothetical protein
MSEGIEIYTGPLNATGGVVEDYRSNLYSVSAWTGTQFSAIYLYSSTASAWTNSTLASGDRNQFWVKGSYPVVSFATFGTSGTTSAAISKIGGSITSIDIGPKSKNTEWSISNGIAYVKMNQKDKLFININNTPSSPLCLFADPLKPPIPTTGSYIYFSAGVSSIGLQFSSFPDNTTIYFDGGSYIKGTLNVSGKNNIKIMGPGILAGDDYYETAIAEKRAVQFGSGDYTSIYKYIPIRGPVSYTDLGPAPDYDLYWPSGNGASGITILKTMFYAAEPLNYIDGVKLISPWEYNTDGMRLFPDKSASTCFQKNCFLFNSDDSLFLIRNNNQTYYRQRGTMLFDNNYIVSDNNGPIVLAYQAEYYGDGTPRNQTVSCLNTDILFFKSQTYSNSLDEPNALIKLYMGNPEPTASGLPSTWGYFNCIISGVRVDNVVEVPIIRLSNYQDPFVVSFRPPAGIASGILIADVTASAIPWAASANYVSGHYSDPLSGVEIRDVTFKNVKINGVKVDKFNYRNYFKFSTASDPVNYPEKNINFIIDIFTKIKTKVSGAWKNCIIWVKTLTGWKPSNQTIKTPIKWI